MLLSVNNISKSFETGPILSGVSFNVERRQKTALVGSNGSGKTTLLRIITGESEPDTGIVTYEKDSSFGYLSQEGTFSGGGTIFEEMLLCRSELVKMEEDLRSLEAQMANADDVTAICDRYEKLRTEFDLKGGYTFRSEIVGVLKGLGFTEEDFDRKASTLSGGQKTRAALGAILVKKPEDLWIYSLIMVGSTLINDAVLWAKVRRLVDFCRPEFSAVKKHFKPMLMLFFPLLAMSVYHLMDKVMLGMLNLFDQGGYYINADKLISIPTNVLTGIGAVLLPRISALRKENKLQEARSLFFLSIEGITAASCAFSFGIAAVANVFVPFFFGPGYDPCIQLTMILAPVLLIKSVSLVMRNAYLIPNRYDRQYIWSVVFGAVCNLIANIILIPLFGAVGASLGTLIAEAAACMWQVVFISRKLPIWGSLAKSLWYVFFGCAMFFAVLSVESAVNMAPVWKLIVEIAIGGAVFCLLCLTYWKISGNPILSIYTANRSNKQENEDSVENERI